MHTTTDLAYLLLPTFTAGFSGGWRMCLCVCVGWGRNALLVALYSPPPTHTHTYRTLVLPPPNGGGRSPRAKTLLITLPSGCFWNFPLGLAMTAVATEQCSNSANFWATKMVHTKKLVRISPGIDWYCHQWPQDGKMWYVTAVLVKIHFLTDCSSC